MAMPLEEWPFCKFTKIGGINNCVANALDPQLSQTIPRQSNQQSEIGL
jgi:hypothetical protein